MAGWKIYIGPSFVRYRCEPSERSAAVRTFSTSAKRDRFSGRKSLLAPCPLPPTTEPYSVVIRPQKHALPASSIARPFSYLRSLRFLSCSELLRLSEVQSPEPEIICNAQSKRKKRKWQQCPGCNRNRKCPCWWPPWPDRRSNFCGQPNNFSCPVPEPNF